MKIVSLSHHKALEYHEDNSQSFIPKVRNPDETLMITFSTIYGKSRRIDATFRLNADPNHDVILSSFECSPFAELILWDIAHTLHQGCLIYLYGSENLVGQLSASWFKGAFCDVTESFPNNDAGHRSWKVFKKIDSLPLEADRGLDKWSFCIPATDGNALMLNSCVSRILELNVPEFEILLCGRPGNDFRYWSKVKIIGEDITAPPIHITRKKNMLANEAKYSNLCILHDRILLPLNFMSAVYSFGDDYPFTAFVSYWLADYWNAVPRRYSDAGMACDITPWPDIRPGREVLKTLEKLHLTMRHPARANFGNDYLTGSLYICKRSVWAHVPQNESLYWQEYEDLEQAFYAAKAGIPSRINPFSITITNHYRSIMHSMGAVYGSSINGAQIKERSPQDFFGFPRRPHLSISASEGYDRLVYFARKYHINNDGISTFKNLTGWRRYILISNLLKQFKGDTEQLLNDWYYYILCEAPVPIEENRLRQILQNAQSSDEWKNAWLRDYTLLRQIYNNPFSTPFRTTKIRNSNYWRVRKIIGSFISALWLRYFSKHVIFHISLLDLTKLIYFTSQEPRPTDE